MATEESPQKPLFSFLSSVDWVLSTSSQLLQPCFTAKILLNSEILKSKQINNEVIF
jgi:hypothetical protein